MPIDEITGEVVTNQELAERVAELILHDSTVRRAAAGLKKKAVRKKGYHYGWHGDLKHIVGLSGNDYRVLWQLLDMANPTNAVIDYDSRMAGTALDLHHTTVNRSMRRLVEKGVLERIGRTKLRPNPELFWIGSSDTQAGALYHQRTTNEQENHS